MYKYTYVYALVINRSKEVGALKQRWTRQLEGRTVLLGVDGLDATKVALHCFFSTTSSVV
jgi:hypothetical protein